MDASALKHWLHQDFSRLEKLLIVLMTFDDPTSVSSLIERAVEAGFRAIKKWNVSDVLSASKGLALRTANGWEISEAGKGHLASLGVLESTPSRHVAADLRRHLASITNEDTREFVEEAIRACEHGLLRSAIVMSWLAAVHVLQTFVVENHLTAFNQEASRIDSKWKAARTTDDLGKMKEGDFLDRLVSLSIVGKNVKEELKRCLDRRNACGHPNSYRLGERTVSHHIEVLMLNVFAKF